jgi:multiple sugar transport system permease protein
MKLPHWLKSIIRYIATYNLLGIVLVVQFSPILWAFVTSLMTPQETLSSPTPLVPAHPTFTAYLAAWQGDILHYYNNSFYASLISTVITMVMATLAAYAFARLQFRFKTPLLLFMLSLSLFPPLAQVIPVYQILRDLHLIGSLSALVLPYSIIGLPLAVLILMVVFQDVPMEIEEAATVDGLTRWGTFLRIIVPMTLPGLFIAAVIIFVGDWNEYLFALSYTTPNTSTLPLGIVTISQTEIITRFNVLSAAIIVSVVPLIIRILSMERRIVTGLTIGIFKG